MEKGEIRKEFLELEPYPDDLKEALHSQIMQLRKQPLKGWERFLAGACIAGVAAILSGGMTAFVWHYDVIMSKTPAHILLAALYVFVVGCAALVLLIMDFRNGIQRLFTAEFSMYAVAGMFLYMYVSSLLMNQPVDGALLGGGILAGICIVVSRLERVGMRLREHMLRNELAVARLTDMLAGKDEERSKEDRF